MKLHKILSIITLLSILTSSAYALQPSDISQVIVFGDSLSDNGYLDKNLSQMPLPVPAGKQATFTTPGGHPWPFYLVRDLGKADIGENDKLPPPDNLYVDGQENGSDYAAGGAVTDGAGIAFAGFNPPSLEYQIQDYLKQRIDADPNALYIFWIGANNLLKPFVPPFEPKLQNTRALLKANDSATKQIADAVAALYAKGAGYFMVVNLPDLSLVPFVQGDDPSKKTMRATLKAVSLVFNANLVSDINAMEKTTGAHVEIFDAYALTNDVVSTVKASGHYPAEIRPDNLYIDNVTESACPGSFPLALNCEPAPNTEHHLFADIVHPTDQAHQLIAQQMVAFIKSHSFK